VRSRENHKNELKDKDAGAAVGHGGRRKVEGILNV